ncbi:MAG: MBOAT family protein [Oscillospiraceae bacterium]|nr:MBOAT family protein [Oscillospiraceae bacterium]
MSFTSLAFILFFVILFALYWCCPTKYKWAVLLLGSCWFYYNSIGAYFPAIAATTVGAYFAALGMERYAQAQQKRRYLFAGILLTAGLLLFFKYTAFLWESVGAFLQLFSISLSPFTKRLLQPIGISFYTLQTLSYLIEVYRGRKAEHHFGIFALYIGFFPQLVSGPIGSSDSLLPQYHAPRPFCAEYALQGAVTFLWGAFKKMCIADRVAYYVDNAYNVPEGVSGLSLLVAVLLYSIQIYADFSGYSDMALGSAQLLGIDLVQNFKTPYFAYSIKEFWSRWHISLSTWLKKYIYIPLGGNRKGSFRTYVNLFITFLFSGLWHGANFTFLIWGGLHGIYQIIGRATQNWRNKLYKSLHISQTSGLVHIWKSLCVFMLASFAWVFFRAENVTSAFFILHKIATDMSFSVQSIKDAFVLMGFDVTSLLTTFGLITFGFLCDLGIGQKIGGTWILQHKRLSRIALCYILIFSLFFFSYSGGIGIYFAF